MEVDIVLATYNGMQYLEPQLKSIFSQDYSNFKLIISDDYSFDSTVEIIYKYCAVSTSKYSVLGSTGKNLGVIQNFNHLLFNSFGNYSFLSDQDDIWLSDKMSNSLQLIQSLESRWGADTPILVHTDLVVATEKLETVSHSFWRSQNLDPTCNSLRQLLMRNHITGCTVVINKALRELALPIPQYAFMHDWWLGLVAAAFGKIAYLKQPTVLYRQHQKNQVGAQSQKWRYISSRLQQPQRIREYYKKTQRQAQGFLERYGSQLTGKDRKILSAYVDLENLTFLRKRQLLFQHGLFDAGLARNLALLSLI
jgi:glycosyltransferase involved in cell wall biosynthesis